MITRRGFIRRALASAAIVVASSYAPGLVSSDGRSDSLRLGLQIPYGHYGSKVIEPFAVD